MNVLIYFSGNSRAVDQQSVMEMLSKKGHQVYLLTHSPKGPLHKIVEQYGVHTFSVGLEKNSGITSYISHIRFLIKFIRTYRIQVVFAHLQAAGLISGIARFFIKFKSYYIRHNSDEHLLLNNINGIVQNKLANIVSRKIISPSDRVYSFLTGVERIKPSKIISIPYGYNFNQYLETDRLGTKVMIREKFNCHLLIISIARLSPPKRHLLMFEVVHSLVQKGFDVKLICLGGGSSEPSLQDYLFQNKLNQNIFLLGPTTNIIDYLEAADIFLHLSETEASNSAVKEAGFCKTPVIVCENVGDFSEYIITEVNGFLVSKERPVQEAVEILNRIYSGDVDLNILGQALYNTVINTFDIEIVARKYDALLQDN